MLGEEDAEFVPISTGSERGSAWGKFTSPNDILSLLGLELGEILEG